MRFHLSKARGIDSVPRLQDGSNLDWKEREEMKSRGVSPPLSVQYTHIQQHLFYFSNLTTQREKFKEFLFHGIPCLFFSSSFSSYQFPLLSIESAGGKREIQLLEKKVKYSLKHYLLSMETGTLLVLVIQLLPTLFRSFQVIFQCHFVHL